MSLFALVITIVVVGVFMWVVNSYIPMQDGLKKLLNILVIAVFAIVVLFWLLGFLGVDLRSVFDVPHPRAR